MLMLSVSAILCGILQLYKAAFVPHYGDYCDGGRGLWRHYFIEIGVSVEIRGVMLSNYILNSSHDI
jgi:hypothetical protein